MNRIPPQTTEPDAPVPSTSSPFARRGRVLLAASIGVVVAGWFGGATLLARQDQPMNQSEDPPTTQPAGQDANADEGEMVTTPEGLQYQVIEPAGEPRVAQEGDVVMVHYTGRLEDGTVFDTSRQVRPGASYPFPTPITFQLGAGQVIRGWEIGLEGMTVGEKRRLVIPPELGYGARGAGNVIPPNATLTFEVELVGLAREEE